MVVDDNMIVCRALARLLRAAGCIVYTAGSGQEAIEELFRVEESNEEPYRVVLMDWKMPDMNGIEATRRIKKSNKLKHSPVVIIVSAFDKSEVWEEAEKVGADAFMSKPVTPSSLVDNLMRFVTVDRSSQFIRAKLSSYEPVDLASMRGAHILLVEDNEINQQVALEILELEGFKVDVADNGLKAIEQLKRKGQTFDCVLMDIHMPVMDGYEAIKAIRKDRGLQDLPVLAMTANAMASDRTKALSLGMNDHVCKPIEPRELFAALSRWIEPNPEERRSQVSQHVTQSSCSDFPELPGIDVQAGLNRVNYNRELYSSLLKSFARQQADTSAQIEQVLQKGDRISAARIVHALKGVSGNLGAQDLFDSITRFENALKRGGNEEVRHQISSVNKSLDQVLNSITRLLKEEKVEPRVTMPVKRTLLSRLDLIAELRELIEESDTNAVSTLTELRNVLWEEPLEEDLNRLDGLLRDFNFDAALIELNRLSNNLTDRYKEQ
jgi:polar amino acid transport system substrate-binding protein